MIAAQRVAGATSRSDLNALIIGRASINSGKVEVFADPENQGSRLIGRASVVNGDWQVQGDVTDLENITATFTDDNGNTSAFAFFGRAPAQGSGGTIDTDGDGVSDALEILAQTDPLNAADAPSQQGTVTALKFTASLNFAVTGKDSVKTSLQLALPTGFTVASSNAAVQIDAVSRSVVLNDKGKSPNGSVAMKLTTRKGATTSILAVSMKAQDLRAGLTPSGLIDKTTAKTGETLTVPIALVLTSGTSKHAYVGSVNVTYKGIQTKRGRAGK